MTILNESANGEKTSNLVSLKTISPNLKYKKVYFPKELAWIILSGLFGAAIAFGILYWVRNLGGPPALTLVALALLYFPLSAAKRGIEIRKSGLEIGSRTLILNHEGKLIMAIPHMGSSDNIRTELESKLIEKVIPLGSGVSEKSVSLPHS